MTRVARLTIVGCVFLNLAIVGCDKANDDGEYARPKDVGAARPASVALVEQGRTAYRIYCIGCHGESGDGNGEAAKFFHPKPRNFILAEYKFSSTRSGLLPTDDDLRRTIRNGLRGSAMPPFELLSENTVDGLVAYVKSFSPKWRERQPAQPIPFIDDPYLGETDLAPAIARGEKVYHGFAACWNCHPSYVEPAKVNEYRSSIGAGTYETFRDHFNESVGKENTQGELIFPPDFKRDYVRAGMSVKDLYRSIAAGITGTAMPTWVDAMHMAAANESDGPVIQSEDLWAIAYYVKSLIEQRPVKLKDDVAVRDRKREIYLHGEPPKPAAPAPTSQPDSDTPANFEF